MDPRLLQRFQEELLKFKQNPLSSFSSYFLWWPVDFFIFVLFQGGQKENLTEEVLAAATFPNSVRLDVVRLLRTLTPGLYDEGSGTWIGTFAARGGPPSLYFMFEALVFPRLIAERLGRVLSQSWGMQLTAAEDFLPFTLYMALPQSTWSTCMQRLARFRRLQFFPSDVPWTSQMINFAFSLRSALLFLLFNFTFDWDRNEPLLQQTFVVFAIRIRFPTFMHCVRSESYNIWNRRYRDFLMRVNLLDLGDSAEIASLVIFSGTYPMAWINAQYNNFVGEGKPVTWVSHVPVATSFLRAQEQNLPREQPIPNFLLLDLVTQVNRLGSHGL